MNNTLLLELNNILPPGAQMTDSAAITECYSIYLFFSRVIENINTIPLVIRAIKYIVIEIINHIIQKVNIVKNKFINKGAPKTGPPVIWR